MPEIGYLQGRLPALSMEAESLPIGPEEFTSLLLDSDLKTWAGGLLDWVRLANQSSEHPQLARPFPDARARPLLVWPEPPWAAYYERFGSIAAPALIREWAREDAAMLAARGGLNGRILGLPAGPVHPRLDSLMQQADTRTEAAATRDAGVTAHFFRWLDQALVSSGANSVDWVYAYAIKLLILTRNGRRLDHRVAA